MIHKIKNLDRGSIAYLYSFDEGVLIVFCSKKMIAHSF